MNPIITTKGMFGHWSTWEKMSDEYEFALAAKAGAVLRKGVTADGEGIEFWDIPSEGRYALEC